MGVRECSLRARYNSVLGMIDGPALRGFRDIGFVTVPALAGLKGWGVQVERHRRCQGRIPHLVVSNVVRDVGQVSLAIVDLRDAVELPVVPDFLYASPEDL